MELERCGVCYVAFVLWGVIDDLDALERRMFEQLLFCLVADVVEGYVECAQRRGSRELIGKGEDSLVAEVGATQVERL